MRGKKCEKNKYFTKNLMIVLITLIFVLTMGNMQAVNAQYPVTTADPTYSYAYYPANTTSNLSYWYPSYSYYYWWWGSCNPDLDVHIGQYNVISDGIIFPVTVHNHWYGEAKNVNLEVYGQKHWVACLNRPPSARLAKTTLTTVPPGGAKTVWVFWEGRKPPFGVTMYAQVDSADIFVERWAYHVSPYFRKKDHSADQTGIWKTPYGEAVAYWPYNVPCYCCENGVSPYTVAVDLIRNPHHKFGQIDEKNEKNNWDYLKKYHVIVHPFEPIVVPLPIINAIPDTVFAGELSIDDTTVDPNMIEHVSVGSLLQPVGTIGAISDVTGETFTPTDTNRLSFDVAATEDMIPFPAALLVNNTGMAGTTEFTAKIKTDLATMIIFIVVQVQQQ